MSTQRARPVRRVAGALAATATLVAASGCGGTPDAGERATATGGPTETTTGETTDGITDATADGLPAEVPTPRPDPADFVDAVDNPYLPLLPGSRWVYRSTGDEGEQRIVVTVTDRTRVVAGVTATVVRDRVHAADGSLLEDTYDWYAQDVDGNVWYLGEDTTAFADGEPDTAGSWEAGVDGARAGVVMPARPQVGQAYQQEYYAGEAEDRGEVLAVGATVRVPVGRFDRVVQTADTTPLEPDLLEHKYYAPGTGVVMEEDVSGGSEVVRLVRFDRPGDARTDEMMEEQR